MRADNLERNDNASPHLYMSQFSISDRAKREAYHYIFKNPGDMNRGLYSLNRGDDL